MNNNNQLPNIVILNEEDQDDRVVRSTDFVLTINTQQLATTDMEANDPDYPNRLVEVRDTFNDMFNQLFTIDNENWGPVNWLDFPGNDGVENIVQPINIITSFERIPMHKPNGGRFHAHILVQIRHNSNVSVATGRLFQLVRQFMQRANINPYCYLRFARSDFDAIIRYMRKDLVDGPNAVRYNHNWRNNNNNNNNNWDTDTEEDDW
jgi:hypothetical protein